MRSTLAFKVKEKNWKTQDRKGTREKRKESKADH